MDIVSLSSSLWIFGIVLLFFLPLYSCETATVNNDVLKAEFENKFVNGKGESWTRLIDGKVTTSGTGQPAEFWLITAFVNLSSSYAEVIYVDIQTEFRLCFEPGQKKNVSCSSNNFEIYINRGDNKPSIPFGKVTSNDLLGVFSYAYTVTSKTSLSKQTFSFKPNDAKGVTFAVRSKGASGTISNMRMFYYYCKETYINSVWLKKTVSPENGAKLVAAICSNNSSRFSNSARLEGYCYSNGSWYINDNLTCVCIEGYQPDVNRGCLFCPLGSYKQERNNTNCTQCPARTVNNHNRTSCVCESGFFRSSSVQISPCYALVKFTSENPITIQRNETNAILKWDAANKTDSLDEAILYDVECSRCKKNLCECTNVKFSSGNINLNATSIVVTNLQPGENYRFRVYPKNSLNDETRKDEWSFAETIIVVPMLSQTFPPSEVKTGQPSKPSKLGLIIGSVVASVVVVAIIILTVPCFFYRRRRKSKLKKSGESGNIVAHEGDAQLDRRVSNVHNYEEVSEYTRLNILNRLAIDENYQGLQAQSLNNFAQHASAEGDGQPQSRMADKPYVSSGAYEQPSDYAQLDSSKRVPIDANYQTLEESSQ